LTRTLDHFWATKPYWRLNPITEAAYVEVTVIMLRIAHLTCSRPITTYSQEDIFRRAIKILQTGHISSEERESARTIEPTFPGKCPALLVRAVAIRALYIAAKMSQMDRLRQLIISAIQYDIDIACDVLDHMSVVWNAKTSQAENLVGLVDIYMGAYSITLSNNIRAIALRNLADILEHLFQFSWLKRTEITSNKFCDFGSSFLTRGSPDLSNAEIRISGSLLALDLHHHIQQGSLEGIAEQIQAWGSMLSDNGRSENVSVISSLAQISFT
jgi:hypothetical protein